jgi:hypothetical protein
MYIDLYEHIVFSEKKRNARPWVDLANFPISTPSSPPPHGYHLLSVYKEFHSALKPEPQFGPV